MVLNTVHYQRIADCFPRQRGNVSMDNLMILNAILYVAENGCKWRKLPTTYGNWHTIYTRMNRWAKSGVLDRIFAVLQQRKIVKIKIDVISLDSTSVKVHPDATGALKKTDHSPRVLRPVQASECHVEAEPPKFIWLPQVMKLQ